MQSPWSVLPLAALMACASASNTREAVRAAEGRYEFIANAPGQLVRGTFRLEGESILLDDGALDCGTAGRRQGSSAERNRAMAMASPASRNTNVVTYSGCDVVTLAFDRRNPVQSKWYAAVAVPRQRQICAERAVQNGREVCVRREMETYEVYEARSGSVQVRRVN